MMSTPELETIWKAERKKRVSISFKIVERPAAELAARV